MRDRGKTWFVFMLAGALAVGGCASHAPPTPAGSPPAAPGDDPAPVEKSSARPFPTIITDTRPTEPALTTDQIRLLVWNVQKARNLEWIGDFRTLSADSDLVLLQEAYLHEGFTGGLAGSGRWDMAEAWRWRRTATGVLTASGVEPVSVRALRHQEPWLRTGKTALVTEYRLAGSEHTLLVANMHAINFSTNVRSFRDQLFAVADLLDEHTGPVILSGDLNTWSHERKRIAHEVADALGLTEVQFDGPRKQFRQFPLDHVFFRGLELLDSAVTRVASSDHNPLHVTFRMVNGSTQPTPAEAH